MKKEKEKKKKAAAAVKSGGGLGGNPESAAVRNSSGTQTLNNYSSSSSSSCEDVPICFFLSTICKNNSTKKQWNPCKWYVLQSESESLGSSGGDDDDDDDGLCLIVIEKQISFETTNDDKDTIVKKRESSCRLIQLPSFPSSLPSVSEFGLINYRLFVFKSRIYLLGGVALPPPSDPYRPYLKGAYCFDTQFFPDKYHNHNGWRKSPDMLSNRFDIAATSVGSKIYLMGAVDYWGRDLPFGEVLDPTLDCDDNHHSTHWSRELPERPSCLLTVGRVAMVGVVEDFGGKKILLYSRRTQQLIFYYDINCNCWSVVADNFGFWTGRLTVALGCVFCFGQLNRYDRVPSLCAYDLATRSWLPVEGLNWDGDIMPLRELDYLQANLFHINHNKLALVWTLNLPCVKQGHIYSLSLHYSKFFIHKTANCIRVHPSFCLSANVCFTGLPTCIPLIGKCFGLRDLEYYEEEIGGMEFMLGDTTKECGKTVVTRESVTRQHMSSHVSSATGKGKANSSYNPESKETPTISTGNSTGKGKGNCKLQPRKQTYPNNLNRKLQVL